MLPSDARAELLSLLNLHIDSCALGKEQLIENLRGKEVYYLGGMESVDPEVILRSDFRGKIVFIGDEPHPIIKESADDLIKARGINVYTTGGGAEAVVQSTLDEIYDPVILQDSFSKAGIWKPGQPGELLGKKNIVIIGTGQIGYRLAVKLLELGHCRSVSHAGGRGPKEDLVKMGIPYIKKLRDAFGFGDILSIHLALIPETRGIIGFRELNAMKPGTIFINNARADLVKKAGLRRYIRQRPRPRTKFIWDTIWTEGPEFEHLSPMEREIVNFLDYTQHTCVPKHIELALPVYGENTLRVTKEKILA